MFSAKKNNNLARFFQIGKVRTGALGANSKKPFSCAKLLIGIAVAFVTISNWNGNLIADELSETHLREVERVFALDQENDSSSLTIVLWEAPSSEPSSIIRNREVDSSDTKQNLKKLDLAQNSLSVISCLKNQPLASYVSKKSDLPYLSNSDNFNSLPFSSFSSFSPLYHLLNHLSEYDNQFSQTFSIHNRSYHFGIGHQLCETAIQLSKKFPGTGNAYNLAMVSQNLMRISLKLESFMDGKTSLVSDSAELINLSKRVLIEEEAMRIPSSDDSALPTYKFETNLWKSIDLGFHSEKHIVIILNGKILSLWHPNQNELHLVNYLTLCDAYQSKSMIMKFAKDLKLSS
jgi:hypothetical protein